MQTKNTPILGTIGRIRTWYALLLLLGGLFTIRLFYLQVIRHDYYQKSANFSQLKQYEIPATRGIIQARSGDQIVPLALNESLYTLFADPKYIKDIDATADALQKAIGGSKDDYANKIHKPDSPRYTILAKRLSRDQNQKIEKLKLKGIGTREGSYRTYPDGQLASQLLGFVNDDGDGKYGIEQALDKDLKGTPGQLKAITDANGVPLAANKDNVVTAPKAGENITLTIDIGLQQQLEDIVKQGVANAKAESGSALIMDANTGAVRAMADFPTYNPAEYYKVSDPAIYNNMSVASPLEPGSIMKTLTTATDMNEGLVNANTSFYDPGAYKIDGATVTDVEEDGGAGQRTVEDILRLSLNTGATWLLMQLGGGQINQQARSKWYDYLTNHYQFGKQTGIEQGYESPGSVTGPNDGYGLNITYANMAFGQGISITPIQMASAFAAAINGGTYHKPTLIESRTTSDGKVQKQVPQVVKSGTVKNSTSDMLNDVLEKTYHTNRPFYGLRDNGPAYAIGGKTGTAQITQPGGGYYADRYNGTYLGFVGGDKPQYVIMVRMNNPKIAGFAGAKSAAPVFGKLTDLLIDTYGVTPKTQ